MVQLVEAAEISHSTMLRPYPYCLAKAIADEMVWITSVVRQPLVKP